MNCAISSELLAFQENVFMALCTSHARFMYGQGIRMFFLQRGEIGNEMFWMCNWWEFPGQVTLFYWPCRGSLPHIHVHSEVVLHAAKRCESACKGTHFSNKNFPSFVKPKVTFHAICVCVCVRAAVLSMYRHSHKLFWETYGTVFPWFIFPHLLFSTTSVPVHM